MALCWPIQTTPPVKAVLVSLADNANDEGFCWPSIATIAQRTCLGKSTVMRSIKQLEVLQLLRCNRSNGRHTTYQLLVRNLEKRCQSDTGVTEEPVPERDRTGVTAGPDRCQSERGPVSERDTNRQEPSGTVIEPQGRAAVDKPQPENRDGPMTVHALVTLMRSHSIDFTGRDRMAIEQISTDQVKRSTVIAAIEEAKQRKPNERIGARYIAGTLRGWASDAAKQGTMRGARKNSKPWNETASGIEAKAVELGIEKKPGELPLQLLARINHHLQQEEQTA